ncbi:MAG: hypothetical protein NTW07_00355, partial [candidate division Zixibacteria bacterium]|nr:hypothetical protein [candidate division Zixibacteria bacterium]
MLRRSTIYLLLIAMSNLMFAGCSKVVNLKLDEVAVDTPKRIAGVVSKSGDEVTFDKKGGEYEPANRRIIGTSRYGERVYKPLRTLDSVRLVSVIGEDQSPVTFGAASFDEYCKRPKADKIVAVVTVGLETHKFWDRCRIDTTNRMFLGPFSTRAIPNIPFDSVAYV